MERLKSPGTARQEKKYRTYRGTTKDRDCIVIHTTSQKTSGDICTSDYKKQAVVVVNKSGQHRFSYTGQWSKFWPWGICTDVLGHILVCEIINDTVHFLDLNNEFRLVILSSQQGIKCPRGVCVDDKNNLYVGQWGTNTVTVYKYLQ